MAAAKSIKDDKKIGFALNSKHNGNDPNDHVYTPAQKADLIAENRVALTKINEALRYSYINPPINDISEKTPYYAKMRSIVRLMALDGIVKGDKNDWTGAVECFINGMKIGIELTHGSGSLGYLVGAACEAINRKPFFEAIDHLNAKQAHDAVNKLSAVLAKRRPLAEGYAVDKKVWHRTVVELTSQPDWRNRVKPFYIALAKNYEDSAALKASIEKLYTPDVMDILNTYTTDAIIKNADTFWNNAIATLQSPYIEAASIERVGDPVNGPMCNPDFINGVRFKILICQTEDSFLLLMLALQSYNVEQGNYPETLENLVPTYLRKVPVDLFSREEPLQYHRDGAEYVLYSIGPDGVDDNATPINNADATGDPKSVSNDPHNVSEDSKGDIVAGVNFR